MRFIRKPGVEAAALNDQTVLFDPDKKIFCVLNETAAFLWEALATSVTSDELLDALAKSFDVTGDENARQDLDDALAELTELDLITAVT